MSLDALKDRLNTLSQLGSVMGGLGWDQRTYMPPGAAQARAEQLAVLSKLTHEMFIADETARLLEAAEAEVSGRDYDDDDAALVRLVRYNLDEATRLPTEFVTEFRRTTTLAHATWAAARANNDFSAFQPTLEKICDLVKQRAEYLGYEDKPYDALLNTFERGMTSAEVSRIFGELREKLVPLVKAIVESGSQITDEPMYGNYPIDKQREFGLLVADKIGFDFNIGRLDETVHPFCGGFAPTDVRITTRYDADWLAGSLFATIHEAGHGLYQQGLPPEWQGLPIGESVSLAIHESQSRMWENTVGRSRGFWSYFYPKLQETFPDALEDVDMETFYQAANYSTPSFIRVEADEVTYHLHVMLRYELESAVVNDGLKIADLPEAWNSKMNDYLGITPPNDKEGILQDVHWSMGIMGYFPTYSLGTLLSAQFYNLALADHPSIPDEIAEGKFDTLLNWTREKIHRNGSKYTPKELVERITGNGIQVDPLVNYLTEKYGELYEL